MRDNSLVAIVFIFLITLLLIVSTVEKEYEIENAEKTKHSEQLNKEVNDKKVEKEEKVNIDTNNEANEPNNQAETETGIEMEAKTADISELENERVVLAKIMYNEARGMSNKAHIAAVAWCILNRYDSGKYGDSILGIATSPNQFAYYPNTPVTEELYWLAGDVLKRWKAEKNGEENVGRVLPKDYYFFTGDGEVNWFRANFDSTIYWDWSLPSPY